MEELCFHLTELTLYLVCGHRTPLRDVKIVALTDNRDVAFHAAKKLAVRFQIEEGNILRIAGSRAEGQAVGTFDGIARVLKVQKTALQRTGGLGADVTRADSLCRNRAQRARRLGTKLKLGREVQRVAQRALRKNLRRERSLDRRCMEEPVFRKRGESTRQFFQSALQQGNSTILQLNEPMCSVILGINVIWVPRAREECSA